MAQSPTTPALKLREQDLTQNTVEFPRRFPLVIDPSNRGSSVDKDARLVNCYCERDQKTGEFSIYGRPGISVFSTIAGSPAGLGCYNWMDNIYSIFGAKIYKDGVDMGAAALNTAGGRYRFDQSLSPSRLLFSNGAAGYVTDGTTVTQITDPDYPVITAKGFGFLDNTNYVLVPSTAAINGSDLNAPTVWDPLNKIIAQIEPDLGIAISKQLVYVAIMKQWSTELFFDAGNATGSPLGRVQGAKVPYGCIAQESVQEVGGALIWAATYRKGNQSSGVTQIVAMDNLKARPVSTTPVERLLEACDFSSCFSWSIAINGHRFYILTMKLNNLTLVYDLEEDRWSQWTDADGNYFPFVSSTTGLGQTHLLQHESNGSLYSCSQSLVTDAGSLITCDIYTPNFDGGIRRRKILDRLEFIGDWTNGSRLDVRCNDKDYDPLAWSNFRSVQMGQDRPYLDNCGTFYRRAYNLRHRCNAKLHINAMEMQLAMGVL